MALIIYNYNWTSSRTLVELIHELIYEQVHELNEQTLVELIHKLIYEQVHEQIYEQVHELNEQTTPCSSSCSFNKWTQNCVQIRSLT